MKLSGPAEAGEPMTKRVRKAVFPVAGLGTRFLPATKAVPKEMLTVVDRPVIDYVVEEAREAGIEHLIFVTGRNKGVIEDHFDVQFELYDTLAQRGKDELDPLEFEDFVRDKMKLLEMNPDFLDRGVNEGFSGGEKKRNEILQMALLEPRLAILDETDSGLDIDALRIVTHGVNKLSNADNAIVLVTHYQRMLNYIVPDFVHVMRAGRIVKTGGKELALDLEMRGYDWVDGEQPATAGA